jgi:hypothetical protein
MNSRRFLDDLVGAGKQGRGDFEAEHRAVTALMISSNLVGCSLAIPRALLRAEFCQHIPLRA